MAAACLADITHRTRPLPTHLRPSPPSLFSSHPGAGLYYSNPEDLRSRGIVGVWGAVPHPAACE